MPNFEEKNAKVPELAEGTARKRQGAYSDIIDLPYPRNDWNFLIKHPRMSMEDRAKIFHPFAALRGHAEALDATAERKQEAVANELLLDDQEFGV